MLPEGASLETYLTANPTVFTEWPKNQFSDVHGGGRSRSATLVITKMDGGVIGS